MNLYGGKGVMEWPDWLLDDLTILNWLNTMVRRDMGLDTN